MTARKTTTFIDNLCFAEGPRWRDGRLWFSDMHDHHVLSVDLDGRVEKHLDVAERPSGLGWLPDGQMLVVSMTDRRVLRVEGDGMVEHANLRNLAEHHCNDMVVDRRGNAYVGNFGFDSRAFARGEAQASPTRLILVTPDGAARKVGGPLLFPNGTVITPDGTTMIVAETYGGRLTAFDIGPDGDLANQRVWAAPEGLRPDGIALDAEGAIWSSSPGSQAIFRIAEGGEILEKIALGQQSYACMLGGDDRQTLFVLTARTSGAEETRAQRAGRIETVRVDVPGAGLP